jgi:hypothetical protein
MTCELYPWGPNKGDKLTDYSRYRNPKKLLEELIESARMRTFLLPGSMPKPGDFYNALPQEYKDVLKNLTAKDIQNPVMRYLEADMGPLWGRLTEKELIEHCRKEGERQAKNQQEREGELRESIPYFHYRRSSVWAAIDAARA